MAVPSIQMLQANHEWPLRIVTEQETLMRFYSYRMSGIAIVLAMLLTQATGSPDNISVRRLLDVMVTRGSHAIAIKMELVSLVQEQGTVKGVWKRLQYLCQELKHLDGGAICTHAVQRMYEEAQTLEREIVTLKEERGPTRSKRGLWSALGAMDSQDRSRLDYDLDVLRGNEDDLEKAMKRQAAVAKTTYDLVKESVKTMEDRVAEALDRTASLETAVKTQFNRTSTLEETLMLKLKILEVQEHMTGISMNLRERIKALRDVSNGRKT